MMTEHEFEILAKASGVLDKLTDGRNLDAKLTHRLNEAHDGLSMLMYYLERHPEYVQPRHPVKAFFRNLFKSSQLNPYKNDISKLANGQRP